MPDLAFIGPVAHVLSTCIIAYKPIEYFMLHIMQVHAYKLFRFSLGLGFDFMVCLAVQH